MFNEQLTIKSVSFKNTLQISDMCIDTIFSKHSRALALTNGSLSCLKVFKTDIGIFFSMISFINKFSIITI